MKVKGENFYSVRGKTCLVNFTGKNAETNSTIKNMKIKIYEVLITISLNLLLTETEMLITFIYLFLFFFVQDALLTEVRVELSRLSRFSSCSRVRMHDA